MAGKSPITLTSSLTFKTPGSQPVALTPISPHSPSKQASVRIHGHPLAPLDVSLSDGISLGFELGNQDSSPRRPQTPNSENQLFSTLPASGPSVSDSTIIPRREYAASYACGSSPSSSGALCLRPQAPQPQRFLRTRHRARKEAAQYMASEQQKLPSFQETLLSPCQRQTTPAV